VSCTRAGARGTGSVSGGSTSRQSTSRESTVLGNQRLTGPADATMSSLPPEILDLIVDQLHGEPTALKTCCVVSESWVPRARKHLFARIEFHAWICPVERWKEAFPDPSNTPAHHTRTLSIYGDPVITAADVGVGGWIRTFHNFVHLRLQYCTRVPPPSPHSTDYHPPSGHLV